MPVRSQRDKHFARALPCSSSSATDGSCVNATMIASSRGIRRIRRDEDETRYVGDAMKLRVLSFALSIDGYGAGPNQDLQNPLGVNGPELMDWFSHTRMWRHMHGQTDGETGIDNEIAE